MNILKEAVGGQEEKLAAEDLLLIHAQSRKHLSPEEIYVFSVRLCDNELDRDFERFTKGTLEELAVLFVGKSGIFDHSWTARGQACRIYKTEVVEESTEDPEGFGEGRYFLKGYAYMVRTDSNKDLISEIEGGIKREVSVGCAVEIQECSICGGDLKDCAHEKGEFYQEARCYGTLLHATDAYEFSFVAVPAQPKAGVLKGKEPYRVVESLLKEEEVWADWCARKSHEHKEAKRENALGIWGKEDAELGLLKAQLQDLLQEAMIGRSYLEEVQAEVKRLGCLCQEDEGMLEALVKKLDLSELLAMKKIFGQKVEKRLPVQVQLDYDGDLGSLGQSDGAFMI